MLVVAKKICSVEKRLRLAKRGEIVFFWSRYGSRSDGLILKAVCSDADKLRAWAGENELPEGVVFVSGTALPSVTLTGKRARVVLERLSEGGSCCREPEGVVI